ncbi:mitochondrial potassium channel ATP-binding subunit-like [Babylonia areolata]|uniref:mitochondrial potassium channel ATP-binding subunit-like n=1 Tax=Babylonia areolata TaxID=304850 RepID=UPI003FD64048
MKMIGIWCARNTKNPAVFMNTLGLRSRGHELRSFASAIGRRSHHDNVHQFTRKTLPPPPPPLPSPARAPPCLQESLLLSPLFRNCGSSNTLLQQLTKHVKTLKTAFQKAGLRRQGAVHHSHLCQSSVLCPVVATLGVGGWWLRRGSSAAECQVRTVKNRLAGRKENNGADARFSWRKLLALLWEDIWYLLLAVLCAIGAAAANIQIPILLGEATNVVSKFTRDATGNFIEEIKKPAMKLILVYGLQGLFTFSYISLLSTIGENLAVRLRRQLFNAYLHQDIAFFDTHKTGELLDRLTSDIQDFKSSFKLCVSQGLKATTQSVGCAVSLFLLSPKLSAMLVFIPGIILGGTLFGSILRKLSREAQDQVAKSTAVAEEAIGNVRTVRAFAMEDKENELYRQELELSRQLNIRLGLGIGAFQALANIFLNTIVLGSIYAGGWLIAQGELSAGDLMSFLAASQTIERSMGQMSVLFGNMVRGMSAGSRVFEYIESRASMSLRGGKTIPYHSMMGTIQFKDVGFSYPTRSEQVVLHDFNLNVPGGRMVALVGLSGGGKSTVAALLERFYDVTKGSISIDGIDIRDLDPSWLRGHAIGFINQEPVLFATSVMENIRYGRPDATDQEVMEAAKLANAHTFITGFPEGYRTVLGERGVTVSGGQKQRIAIARALIKNPSILVLDEATSALDAESERVVQEALDKVTKGRTVVVIAHRLSTVRDADIIAVVSHGKIVELGDHQSLKKKRGMYWELIKQQELEQELEGC